MGMLIKQQEAGKEWSISLYESSPESTLVLLRNLNKCTVRVLEIWKSPLDSECISILSKTLKTNKTIKRLWFDSSLVTGGIEQICNTLFTNTTLIELIMWHIPITDEDIIHLSNMLSRNNTLQELDLYSCNITDNGVQFICEGLTRNQTLTTLNIGGNRQITSISTSIIADLIQTTISLTELNLCGTSLSDDDIKIFCTALRKTTIKKLCLSKLQHQEYCQNLDSYSLIKDKLKFSF